MFQCYLFSCILSTDNTGKWSDILDKYDHQQLSIEGTTSISLFIIDYIDARKAIFDKDKSGGSSLLGNEKDQSFKSSIATNYQTFGGLDLYPSVI